MPNHEQEYYSDSSVGTNPFSIKGGVLDITASRAVAGSNPYNLPYTSGVITTYNSFSQLYGYFEVRAELPAGQGLWPAFWMLPADNVNTAELDVFEMLGNSPTTIYATTHDTVPGAAPGVQKVITVANTSTAFHTYGVDWEPTTVTFYMDGQVIASAPTPASMHVPMYMLVNLAVGGSWPGSPNASTKFPATMQIDYVRAYATAATTAVSGSAAITRGGLTGKVILNGVAQGGVAVSVLDSTGNVVAKATSSANGAFQFAAIGAGTYKIQYAVASGAVFIASAIVTPGQTTALANGAFVAAAALGGNALYANTGLSGVTVALLNQSANVVASTTTSANGGYAFNGLAAGTYRIQFTTPNGMVLQAGGMADAATRLTAAIPLAVGQGVTLPPEVLVPASTLSGYVLLDGAAATGVTVSLEQPSGAVVSVQTTNGKGSFSFTNLGAGSYRVLYTPPSGAVLQNGSQADTVSGLAPLVTLAQGQSLTTGTEILLSNPAEIQGNVHHFGGNADPLWGTGMSGVTVSLLYASGGVIASTVTVNGWFVFRNIAAGNYQIAYVPPAGSAVMPGGSADPATGLTAPFLIAAGQSYFGPMASIVSTTGITGQVLLAGVGEAGVTVSLLNAVGQVAASTVTGVTGAFAFNGLSAGTYSVSYSPPDGQVAQAGGPTNSGTTTSAINLADGQGVALAPLRLVANPATLDGMVHHFGSGDPVWGSPQAGVTVALLDASGGTLATFVTGWTGWFDFTGLTAGSYQLRYSPPAGQVLQAGGTADTTTGLTASFTLANGQTLWLPAGAVVSSPTIVSARAMMVSVDSGSVPLATASDPTLSVAAPGDLAVPAIAAFDPSVPDAGPADASVPDGASGDQTTVGAGDLLDSAVAPAFLGSDGSSGQVFMLNAASEGPTTISGFDMDTNDVLDLARALAGTDILPDLSNVGAYVTSEVSNGGTTLYLDTTGTDDAPTALAILTGVSTDVSDLFAGNHLSLV